MVRLNVLLSCLYSPNSSLLDHYVEKEQGFFYSQHGPNHLTYLHIVIGLVGSQGFLIAGLSRSAWQFLPAHVEQLVQRYLCFTDKQRLVTLLCLYFPLCSTGLFVSLLSVHLPVSSLLSLTQSTAQCSVQGQGEQHRDFLLKSSTSKADSPLPPYKGSVCFKQAGLETTSLSK